MTRASSRTRTARWIFLAALLAPGRGAAQGAAPPPGAEPWCAQERWLLEGASARPEDAAAYVPEWNPVVEGIAACLRTPPLADACLVVRGHADAVPFGDVARTAYGSEDAVQVARGRGRALMVIARLAELGVGSERLRESPPVIRSGVRGVEIWALRTCLPAAAERLPGPELEALVDRRTAEALARHEAREREAAAAEPAAPREAPDGGDDDLGPARAYWADLGADATLLGFRPDTVLAPGLQLGAGARQGRWLARLGAGVTTGSTRTQRLGFEASLSAGRHLARWLELGAQLRWRLASDDAGSPWLEQSFALGAQAAHCLWTLERLGAEVCLTEAVLPLGLRQRQGDVAGGRPVRTPWRVDYALELQAGVMVRKRL